MTIKFNHTIVAAKDKKQSATWLTELFDLPGPEPFGHFLTVTVANDVSLDYAEVPDGQEIPAALRVPRVRGRVRFHLRQDPRSRPGPLGRPGGTRPGEINHNDGGRGVYFQDPAGHYMEILTRPYGSGG